MHSQSHMILNMRFLSFVTLPILDFLDLCHKVV